MKLKSIRWQLPLSYAAVALLAALVLGTVLLVVLRSYYERRERFYLINTAQAVHQTLTQLLQADLPYSVIEGELNSLAYISQTRLRVLDPNGQVLLDTGIPRIPLISAVTAAFEAPQVKKLILPEPGETGAPSLRIGEEQGEIQTSRRDDFDVLFAPGPFTSGFPSDASGLITFTLPVTGTPGTADRIETIAVLPASAAMYGFDWRVEPETDGRRSTLSYQIGLTGKDARYAGSIMVSDGPAYGWAIVTSVGKAWVVASAIAVLLAAGAGWAASRRVTGPLGALTQVTERMAAGDLSARAQTGGPDEFGALGDSFNQMAGQIEETVTTLRRFMADAAHELHTPLTALRTNLELATEEADAGRQTTYLMRAQAQLERLNLLTQNLLDLSRLESGGGEQNPVDLVTLVRAACEPYATQAEQMGIDFAVELAQPDCVLPVNDSQIRSALENLLDNALKFTPSGGAVRVRLETAGAENRLIVEDNGIGIPPEDLDQLFERFHRGRNAAGYPGSGLGLAIVRAVAQAHGGQIQAETIATGGARFTLSLPCPRA